MSAQEENVDYYYYYYYYYYYESKDYSDMC